MKRPITRRYIVSVTVTVASNPQKRRTDTWSVVTCIQIGYGAQQSNAGIRKCLPLFFANTVSPLNAPNKKISGDWMKAECTPQLFIRFI
jgi:hypothetical protein